ncbi:MAG: hypothetical protein IIT97_01885 [Mycoplasmataceae bacterium]|nr:hypothetical protein [Mycoplasmataceae bacterium]MBQ5543672.1 hypothetical protein [Mycoplasmataceae bacterium]
MRKFFETPDGQLLEIDSPLSLNKTNIKEYVVRTSNDADEPYMPVITKTELGYSVKVNEEKEVECDDHEDGECCGGTDPNCCHAKNEVIFVELDVDSLKIRRFLAKNEKPEVNFHIPHGTTVQAYAYSTKGGLWTSSLKEDEKK